MGSRIAPKLVRNELPWWLPLMFQHLKEEALSSLTISPARHQNIDHISTLIHRSPHVVALAPDRDEEFVNIPDVAQSPLPSSQRSSVAGSWGCPGFRLRA